MKSTFKKAMMPLAVVVLGAAAAFATNAAKQSDKQSVIMDAYHYDISQPVGQRCVIVRNVDCAPGPGPVCTDLFGNQLWGSPTENNQTLSCSTYLAKP